MNKKLLHGLIAFVAIVVVLLATDLIVKQVATSALAGRPDVVVIPGFWSFHYIGNPDTGFSFLRTLGLDSLLSPRLKIGVIVAVQFLGVLVAAWFFFSPRNYLGTWVKRLPLALIAAGGLGNAIDRLIRGFVVDYVHWYLNGVGSWPIFNLADTYTVCGALALIAFLLFTKKEKKSSAAPVTGEGELK